MILRQLIPFIPYWISSFGENAGLRNVGGWPKGLSGRQNPASAPGRLWFVRLRYIAGK